MDVFYSFPGSLGLRGTVGTTAWHHVAGLSELGANVTVVCGTRVRELPAKVRVIETGPFLGSNLAFRIFGRLAGVTASYRRHDRKAAAFLSRSGRRTFDVVHCWPLGAEETLKTARQLGIPSVLERSNAHTATAYEVVEAAYRELGLPMDPSDSHARNADVLAREEREYALADLILCPSEFVFRSFVDRGFDPAKLFLTGRGYDPGRYNVEGRPTSTGAFNACFVGSGGPRKGLHYALEAWAKSGAAAGGGKFRIAGNLSPSYLKVLEPLLQDPSVELVGYIDDAAPLMRASDVLILPSLEEASAKATYEARGCGCVLVVSDRSAGPAVHNQDAMVHAAGNVDELTDHLRTLLTDREALERIRAESLLVAKRSTWSDAASRLISAYTSVAAPNRPD